MTQQQQNQQNRRKSGGRGFAGMDPERQREIAREGGRSVPAEERSFSKNPELASEAGRKGGENSHGGRNQRQERENRESR